MKILIADDEPLARKRLRRMLNEINEEYIILSDASNGLDALNLCIQEEPTLALLDIRMPKMDGLQVAAEISKARLSTAIVFTTAFDEYALSAFDTNAIDYLLKPIKKERLELMLAKIKHFNLTADNPQQQLDIPSTPRQHLCNHTHAGTNIINVSDILYFKADHKYVCAVTANDTFLLEDSLKVLEIEFKQLFLRIHRNALINIEAIRKVTRATSGYQVLLKGLETPIRVSRRHQAQLNAFLQKRSQVK